MPAGTGQSPPYGSVLVDVVSPAQGSVLVDGEAVTVDVVSPTGAFSAILIALRHGTGYDVVWDGAGFAPRYAALSTRSVVDCGYRFTLRRTGGWPDAPSLVVVAADDGGNSFAVTDVSPSEGVAVERLRHVTFTAGQPAASLQWAGVLYGDGEYEVGWDGTEFAPEYSPGSSRELVVGAGWDYVLRRTTGWRGARVVLRPVMIGPGAAVTRAQVVYG